jgi:hypothetical protein
MKISRLAFSVCAVLAIPLLLPAQETKLVNCRSLEAAGNFVGPDEVIDGDRVCKKAEPGEVTTAKPEPEKPAPAANPIPNVQPVSVAEAARANAAAKAAAKKAAPDKDQQASKPVQKEEVAANQPAKADVPTPASAAKVPNPASATPPGEPAKAPESVVAAPAAQPAAVATASSATPVSVSPPSAAPAPAPASVSAPPVPASTEEASSPAFTSAVAPVVKVQPTAASSSAVAAVSATAAAAPAPPVRIHRDAPVAPGTPSEAPEIDHGFSDANAVQTPAPSANGISTAQAAQTSAHNVQLGGFEKSDGKSSAPEQAASTCAKNITLSTLRDGQLSLASPAWAGKWIANNQSRLPNVCFSPAPVKGAKNYLIVFYAAPGNGQSGGTASMPLPDGSGGAGDFTTKDASWHYSAERAGTTSAATSDASSLTQVWYATAYTETGAPVAERWPNSSKPADAQQASQDLLNAVVEDLRKL